MTPAIAHFKKIQWCNTLIQNPAWEPVPTVTRIPKPSTEDAFFAETLASSRTIKHILTLRPKFPSSYSSPSSSSSPSTPNESKQDGKNQWSAELKSILEIGPGVNGHPGLAHGGFVATMLDEILGLLISLHFEREWEEQNRRGENPRLRPIFTACEFSCFFLFLFFFFFWCLEFEMVLER